ncbi:MAG TPA: MATE family efflux transporter [Lacibacter sp.]|nr:MATE family efflux transporter [Lacibacter sp.]HMO89822.1 MATE family efflux transporter [Lacibacter sp.]
MTNKLQLNTSNRQILSLSLPISIALVVPFLNFSINNFFLSRLGESELGTAGITGVFFLVLAVLGNGLNNALQAIISRRAGENNASAIGETFGQGLRIALFFAAGAILLTWLLAPFFLSGMLRHQEVEERAVNFLLIRVWGLPFLYLFQLCNALLVGTTNSRYLIIGAAAEAAVNIVLDYGLIFGKLGLPRLGFNGAAWASVLAEAVALGVVLLVIHRKKLHRQFRLFDSFRLLPDLTRLLLKTSAPLIGQYSISIISWLFFYIFLEHQGERSLAVSNIMRNIFSLTGIFTWAFAATTNTMVSNLIGQNRQEEVTGLIRKIMQLSLLSAVLLLVFLNIFARPILSLYGLSDAFIATGVPVLRVVSAGILVMSISVVWLNAVTGTGHTTVNLLIEALAIVLYMCYVYLVLEHLQLGLLWGWASEILYWGVILLLAWGYMRSGRWQKKTF